MAHASLAERPAPAACSSPPRAHTPGPWVWIDHSLRPANPDPEHSAVHTIVEAESIGVGFVCSDWRTTIAESDSNKALIAAAPQLLDAARAAAAVFSRQKWRADSTDPEAVALAKLRAAIAAAAGGEA